MHKLAIKVFITRLISTDQPGFVECVFIDAWGKTHTVHEELPVITDSFLGENHVYPPEGFMACEWVKEWKDENGRTLLTVNSTQPWGIETIDGQTEFDLQKQQLCYL